MLKKYHVIYDGNCNLCVTFTQLLENFDKGNLFSYIPMQNREILQQLKVTSLDCELGMILIDNENLHQRWQGSIAAEKIIELLPNGEFFINAYRAIPSLKWLGDKSYLQIRDNRYQWFGSRDNTYYSSYDLSCKNNPHCQP